LANEVPTAKDTRLPNKASMAQKRKFKGGLSWISGHGGMARWSFLVGPKGQERGCGQGEQCQKRLLGAIIAPHTMAASFAGRWFGSDKF
jgi:hypothetical protein